MEPYIHQTAEFVAEHGDAFEEVVKGKNQDNPVFKFLFDDNIKEYHFYNELKAKFIGKVDVNVY